MKRFFSFLISKTFLIHLIIALVLVWVGFMITLRAIANYTNHGVSYEVPRLNGVNIAEAEPLLEHSKMQLVIADSLFMDGKTPGTILEQLPKAGQRVKEGRKVFVSICASNPDQILMPKVTDISFRQAMNIIQASDLRIGDVKYQVSEFEDLVLEQKYRDAPIAAGNSIAKGSYIDLVVGKKGAIEKVNVPKLRGLNQSEVNNVLTSLNLSLGAVIFDHSVVSAEDSINARVFRQNPVSDNQQMRQIDYGSLVDVWMSIDSTKYMEIIPITEGNIVNGLQETTEFDF
ncbi:MAG: PASTA domain-containing protein [Mangrovibacterium sp.]